MTGIEEVTAGNGQETMRQADGNFINELTWLFGITRIGGSCFDFPGSQIAEVLHFTQREESAEYKNIHGYGQGNLSFREHYVVVRRQLHYALKWGQIFVLSEIHAFS